MSLLSFRAPVLYAACHRCGNALTQGEDECPHCGTNQSRALRVLGAANTVDYRNNVVLMPGRMLVPYPSVPEEIDTAMNIARERKRVLKRVAFYLASGGMLAMALGLAYAPALRSPVVQRLAALPEPAMRRTVIAPVVPVAPEDNAEVAVAASATVLAAASSTNVRDVAPAPQAFVKTAPPVSVTSNQASQPVVPHVVKQAAADKPASVAPPVVVATKPVAPPVVAVASADTSTTAEKAVEAYASASAMASSALASVETQAHAFNDKVANTYNTLLALAASTIHPATAEVSAQAEAMPDVSSATPIASKPATVAKAAPPAHTNTANTPTVTVQQAKPRVETTVATQSVPVMAPPVPVVTTTTAAAPNPTATADVPIASHAPEPSALTENGLPRMSMAPISPAMTAERPPAGSPGETLYIARLALLTNDLSAARKNLAEVPSSLAHDVEAKRIREELAQRESARDTAMQRARACDAASSWRCARRYAKEAITIDTSYPDSRVLLKRVNFKAAQAKKAADAAALQAANNAAHAPVHSAPIREAVAVSAVPRAVNTTPGTLQQNTYVAPQAPSNNTSAPHLFATPPVRATHESHVIHDVRETRPITETREPIVVAPVKAPEPEEPQTRVFGGGVPIRPPGRGDAH